MTQRAMPGTARPVVERRRTRHERGATPIAANSEAGIPTWYERALQRLATHLSRFVDARMVARAERRELLCNLLREQQTQKQDPSAIDRALLLIGSRPR